MGEPLPFQKERLFGGLLLAIVYGPIQVVPGYKQELSAVRKVIALNKIEFSRWL
jgi:hypothetical protein